MPFNKFIMATLAALAIGGGAQAVPLIGTSDISYGENGTPVQSVSGDPVAARNALLGKLDGSAGSFGFEFPSPFPWSLQPPIGAPLDVNFNAGSGNGTGTVPITATLSGIGDVSTATAGRFNTTAGGSRFLSVNTGSEFVISFDTAIAAFGFYGTDIGDFGGTLTAYLKHAGANNTEEDMFVIRPGTIGTPPVPNPSASGALLFWGFASIDADYDRIRFVASGGTATDVFGFDDFVVADRSQIRTSAPPTGVPEPASLALVGLALLGAAAAARRRA